MENLKLELKALANLVSQIDDIKAKETTVRLLDTITELESGRVFESELIWE